MRFAPYFSARNALVVASLATAFVALPACKDNGGDAKDTTGTSRSDAVRVAPGSAPATAPTPPAHAATDASSSAPRVLCQSKPASFGHTIPDVKFGHLEASGESPESDRLDASGGRWTWINFWAGWCGPCREEMARLRAFELAEKNVRVAFVSLDDDARQATQFLDTQPANGVRKSRWLQDDKQREAFLGPLRIDGVPTLPMHLLFGPDGKLRCRIDGAIEDRDLPGLRRIFAEP